MTKGELLELYERECKKYRGLYVEFREYREAHKTPAEVDKTIALLQREKKAANRFSDHLITKLYLLQGGEEGKKAELALLWEVEELRNQAAEALESIKAIQARLTVRRDLHTRDAQRWEEQDAILRAEIAKLGGAK